MPSFKVAHIHEQGVDLIIVPVGSSFNLKPASEQMEIVESLELAAHSAGLKGTVVPVWQLGDRTVFVAPNPWHPFFKGLSWRDITANVNGEISW